jgi:hypothetical protein
VAVLLPCRVPLSPLVVRSWNRSCAKSGEIHSSDWSSSGVLAWCWRLLVNVDRHLARRHHRCINDLTVAERFVEFDGEGRGRIALTVLVAITRPDADPQPDPKS